MASGVAYRLSATTAASGALKGLATLVQMRVTVGADVADRTRRAVVFAATAHANVNHVSLVARLVPAPRLRTPVAAA